MYERILAIAENGWVELKSKKAWVILGGTLLFCFVGPIYIQHNWFMNASGINRVEALARAIISLDQLTLFIGLCAGIVFGASSVEAEVSRRTICSVMIRPIHHWEYLAGRILSLILFFFLFVLFTVTLSYVMALMYGGALPAVYLWGALQKLIKGIMWIVIALSLGSVLSSAGSLSILVLVGILSFVAPYLSNDIHWIIPLFKKLLHFILPSEWPLDYWAGGGNGSVLLSLGVVLENLMYAVLIFLGCSWVFSSRDLKLRE
jgi:ABC-type transport system involved in multi-copper enzyme maturation permease subunit